MQLSHLLSAALAAATGASAFALDTFSGPGCTGNKQYVNIYDNTCGTWMNGFQSYRVIYYGGSNQNAKICKASSCHTCFSYNAGRDSNFQKGPCYTPGGGLNSLGSFTI
ncbi:hypothetical protein F5X68DRAFT_234463 [Plectosphaerella plurivora]|uniref:Uncharacterized protein n=1 Tax=Plectosphaerella plurivora TaxID=936078 RepID=A0A9P8V699_9PEZI|nr:hypothetical protein F5X68DRAFT_234463 [Plectosphaerella plurivora]